MLRQVIIFSGVVVAGVTAMTMTGHVSPLQQLEGWATTPSVEPAVTQPTTETAAREMQTPSLTNGRQVSLTAASSGHFEGDFRINGQSFKAMVDTGATVVAINTSMARKAGIKLKASDFRHQVRTANGTTLAAPAVINRLEIGRISVSKVEAMVLSDDALSSALVGISFLRRLQRYEVEDYKLLMVQ